MPSGRPGAHPGGAPHDSDRRHSRPVLGRPSQPDRPPPRRTITPRVDVGRLSGVGDRADVGRQSRSPAVDPRGRSTRAACHGIRGVHPAARDLRGTSARSGRASHDDGLGGAWPAQPGGGRGRGKSRLSWTGRRPGPSARQAYRDGQRDTIVAAVARYAPGIPVVAGVEVGHTSPQYVLPYGGPLRLDPAIGALVVENGASTASGARQEAKGCV